LIDIEYPYTVEIETIKDKTYKFYARNKYTIDIFVANLINEKPIELFRKNFKLPTQGVFSQKVQNALSQSGEY